MKPTIVLVHGAFAESASWDGVIDALGGSGLRALAAPNPLRGLAQDAAVVTDAVKAQEGPVVLVGHSYGGAVITNVDAENVVGLVYVAAFAPAPGETCSELSARYPGSTLADSLEAVPRRDGTTDLRIARARFHAQFCADVPAGMAARMAVTQRPITREALLEPSGERALWRTVPSWFVIAEADHNIPAAAQRHMADRARAERVIEVEAASHAVALSHPHTVADLILEAATLPIGV